MKRLISFTSVLAIASVVLVACQKEVSTFEEQQDVQNNVSQIKIHKDGDDEWEFNIEDSLSTEWVLSTYFFYSDDPENYFLDEDLNTYYFAFPPIFDQPIGDGGVDWIQGGKHVICRVKDGGTNCGRVWVDVNGVDNEGVYYRDPVSDTCYIDMSWHLR